MKWTASSIGCNPDLNGLKTLCATYIKVNPQALLCYTHLNASKALPKEQPPYKVYKQW